MMHPGGTRAHWWLWLWLLALPGCVCAELASELDWRYPLQTNVVSLTITPRVDAWLYDTNATITVTCASNSAIRVFDVYNQTLTTGVAKLTFPRPRPAVYFVESATGDRRTFGVLPADFHPADWGQGGSTLAVREVIARRDAAKQSLVRVVANWSVITARGSNSFDFSACNWSNTWPHTDACLLLGGFPPRWAWRDARWQITRDEYLSGYSNFNVAVRDRFVTNTAPRIRWVEFVNEPSPGLASPSRNHAELGKDLADMARISRSVWPTNVLIAGPAWDSLARGQLEKPVLAAGGAKWIDVYTAHDYYSNKKSAENAGSYYGVPSLVDLLYEKRDRWGAKPILITELGLSSRMATGHAITKFNNESNGKVSWYTGMLRAVKWSIVLGHFDAKPFLQTPYAPMHEDYAGWELHADRMTVLGPAPKTVAFLFAQHWLAEKQFKSFDRSPPTWAFRMRDADGRVVVWRWCEEGTSTVIDDVRPAVTRTDLFGNPVRAGARLTEQPERWLYEP